MDVLVLEKFSEKFISFQTMSEILAPLTDRQSQKSKAVAENLETREAEVLSAKHILDNLYQLVEEGLVNPSDPDFEERFSKAKAKFKTRCLQRDQEAKELMPEVKVDHQKYEHSLKSYRMCSKAVLPR